MRTNVRPSVQMCVHTYVHMYVHDPVRLRLRHLYQVEFCSFIVRYPTRGHPCTVDSFLVVSFCFISFINFLIFFFFFFLFTKDWFISL